MRFDLLLSPRSGLVGVFEVLSTRESKFEIIRSINISFDHTHEKNRASLFQPDFRDMLQQSWELKKSMFSDAFFLNGSMGKKGSMGLNS